MPESSLAQSVTVVVVTWQGRHLLGACLDSLREQTVDHQVLVVDNASTDGTTEFVASSYPEARVLQTGSNTGFAGAVARALHVVDTAYLALLNNDATAAPGWLEALLDHAESQPQAAAVTSRMLLAASPRTLNNTGVLLLATGHGTDRDLGRPDSARPLAGEVFGFSGGAALLRTPAVRAVGGMPARFFLYYEDTDLSWRLRLAGWEVRYEPAAVVHHEHSATVDQQSETFAFHNERNRLLTLARCAPAGMAVRAVVRFPLTTVSLTVRRLLGATVPDAANFRPRLRLQVLASFLRLLPWALRSRHAVVGSAVVRPSAVASRWVGRED
jgi:GT2 family glycosyltransferase